MPAIRIGVQLASLGVPLRKGLELARRMGAAAVELDARGPLKPKELGQTGLRELRRLLEEHELGVSAIGFRTRRGYDSPEELDRRVAATKDALRLAADLRAGVVINQLGDLEHADGSPEWRLLVESLSDIGVFSQRVGAMLAGTLVQPSADFERLVSRLPPHSIGLNLDPGGLVIHGQQPLAVVADLGRHVLHAAARDAARERTSGRGLEVPLGRGSVDFPALLGALEEHEYRGYFTIFREHSADPVFEIGEAVKYLKNL